MLRALNIWRNNMFPISINKEKGYFVNADGTPFFWNGDTCWKLFWELKKVLM